MDPHRVRRAGPAERATWEYGPEHRPGDQHIVWRRIGGHDILNQP
ncbi:hypothetical protein [Streptomyces achromogenes]